MYKRIAYLLIALLINFILALVVYRVRQGTFLPDAKALGYVTGLALVYWLRPFLFVGLAWLFFLLTRRKFTVNAALSVYAIAWTVMLVGMFNF